MIAMVLKFRRYFFALMILVCVLNLLQLIELDGFLNKKEQTDIMKFVPNTGVVDFKITVESKTNVTKRLFKRRLWVRKKCASSNFTRRHVLDVTGYAPARFTICNVPKAACTIWLRLFTYLIIKNRKSHRTLASLTKFDVHYNFDKSRENYDFKGKDRMYVMTYARAITARDPYTRLWSAYIDKILLPDFWKGTGRKIIKMTRPNATDIAKRCGNDVTFPEFVQYVLNIGHSVKHWGFDFHWLPVTDICDPCLYEPAFILKQETFLSDFTFVMDQIGLLDEAKPLFQVNQDLRDIASEIQYNFEIYPQVSDCATKLQLANLIWRAMKLNGYLQPNETFPAHLTDDKISISTLVRLVLIARKRNVPNKQTKYTIRKQALIDAYQQLSKTQIKELQYLYQVDFEMFGYDNSPPV